MKIEILKANKSHAKQISAFAEKTFRQTFCGKAYYTDAIIDGYAKLSLNSKYFESCLTNEKQVIYMLMVDGTFAGYLHLEDQEPPSDLSRYSALFVHRVYIDSSFKGHGFGKLLMEKAYSEAKSLGYDSVWLGVWEFNQQAQEFYIRQGFKHISEWEWAYESQGVRYVDRDLLFVKML
ncbi:MAG: GNAT family N-acetyltransferase [Proteobacteria bacterium]|nr:GNAT family N-acetyltransferase [Pseudomonadota bacterium]